MAKALEKPSMTRAIASKRIGSLQQGMRSQTVDALVSLKPETSFYLSGFNPVIWSHPIVAILPVEGEPTLLVHALRDQHAREASWVEDIRSYGSWSTVKTMGPNWLAAFTQIMTERGLQQAVLGYEGGWMPVRTLEQLRSALPQARFVDVGDLVEQARLVKDEDEIRCARIAAHIASVGVDAAIAATRDGVSEREISIVGQAAMNALWISDYPDIEVCDFSSLEGGAHNGLWCWVITGERILVNADNPTMRKVKSGEITKICIWANCNGIHTENERSVAVGRISEKQKTAYDAVLEIRARVEQWIRPGVRCADLYDKAKQEYVRLGFERYLPGRIGHGIGLGAHESPSIDPRSEIVLEPGMVISFEPNLRIPEWGGLQHSDSVLITQNGFEFLTTNQRGFIQV